VKAGDIRQDWPGGNPLLPSSSSPFLVLLIVLLIEQGAGSVENPESRIVIRAQQVPSALDRGSPLPLWDILQPLRDLDPAS
jgi:hypothetical protein